jgi:hypothetical protein
MVEWARLHGIYEPAHDVPMLLHTAETGAEDAWNGLWTRLWHQQTTCEAGIAAVPMLAVLAQRADPAVRFPALELAGAIVGAALLGAPSPENMEELRESLPLLSVLADGWLSERPADYLNCFRAKLAFDGFPMLNDNLDDFRDTCYEVPCPQCSDKVSIAIGDFGCYSSIRDWMLGDVHPIPLCPASPEDLQSVERGLHDAALRDDQPRLAWGLRHLFGKASCGTCSGTFSVISALEARRTWPFEF